MYMLFSNRSQKKNPLTFWTGFKIHVINPVGFVVVSRDNDIANECFFDSIRLILTIDFLLHLSNCSQSRVSPENLVSDLASQQ